MHDNCTQIATTVHELWDHEGANGIGAFMNQKVVETFPEEIQEKVKLRVQGWLVSDAVDGNIIVNVDWSWDEA